jgi:hypothetical protein
MAGFEQALKQLVQDPNYRASVAKDATQLKRDHNMSAQELALLMQVWVNSSEDAHLSIWDLCHCCCSTTKE